MTSAFTPVNSSHQGPIAPPNLTRLLENQSPLQKYFPKYYRKFSNTRCLNFLFTPCIYNSSLGLILQRGKAIASMPPGHCLGALEMLCHKKLTISSIMPWCPRPFKNKTYRPASQSNQSKKKRGLILKYKYGPIQLFET